MLIAHEYRHEVLSELFKDLADTLEKVAEQAVMFAVQSYARVLQAGTTKLQEQGAMLEAAFISRYALNRIAQPARSWYDANIAEEVERLVKPLIFDLSSRQELDVRRMEEQVSMRLFTPKSTLMQSFRNKIAELQGLVDNAQG